MRRSLPIIHLFSELFKAVGRINSHRSGKMGKPSKVEAEVYRQSIEESLPPMAGSLSISILAHQCLISTAVVSSMKGVVGSENGSVSAFWGSYRKQHIFTCTRSTEVIVSNIKTRSLMRESC